VATDAPRPRSNTPASPGCPPPGFVGRALNASWVQRSSAASPGRNLVMRVWCKYVRHKADLHPPSRLSATAPMLAITTGRLQHRRGARRGGGGFLEGTVIIVYNYISKALPIFTKLLISYHNNQQQYVCWHRARRQLCFQSGGESDHHLQ